MSIKITTLSHIYCTHHPDSVLPLQLVLICTYTIHITQIQPSVSPFVHTNSAHLLSVFHSLLFPGRSSFIQIPFYRQPTLNLYSPFLFLSFHNLFRHCHSPLQQPLNALFKQLHTSSISFVLSVPHCTCSSFNCY